MLAAIRRCPLGLPGVGTIVRLCGLDEGTAAACLDRLVGGGYLAMELQPVPCAPVGCTTSVYRPGPKWLDLWPEVVENLPPLPPPRPTRDPEGTAGPLPERFWHMWWNGTPSRLSLPTDANHIAIRLICSRKTTLALQAWALCNLPTSALRAAASGRNPPDEPTRAMIQNMVAARRGGLVADPG